MGFRGFAGLIVLLAWCSGAMALELKDIPYNTKDAGKVVFSHTTHLKKKKQKSANISCKACHNDNMKKNVRYTMADMEKGKSCGMCHNGKTAFDVAKCTACHKVKDITYKVKETGPLVFSHTKHLKNMQCNACHNKYYKTGRNPKASMADMEKGKSCGACHTGKTAFALKDCSRCHPAKEVTFNVKETGAVKFSHEVHTSAYKCGECHPGNYKPGKGNPVVTMAAMEKGKSCGACHNGKDAFAVKECAKCHPTKDITYKVKGAGGAKFSHAFHTGAYSCGECHPKIYKPAAGNPAASMSDMQNGKSCGACHDDKTAFGVKASCAKCHNM
jgi:c(7)-type cytochrome triheme protein